MNRKISDEMCEKHKIMKVVYKSLRGKISKECEKCAEENINSNETKKKKEIERIEQDETSWPSFMP